MSYNKHKFIRICEGERGHCGAKKAYEKTERLHQEKFGGRKYKNYETYKVVLCRYKKQYDKE
jgi:hypothetical protein